MNEGAQPGVDVTHRQGFTRASVLNVIGNALKIIVEGAVGLAFGSIALLADAAHSVADLVGSLVVLIWGRQVYDAPDVDHPHGHQRIEPLAALFVGGLIILLGLNLLYESIQGFLRGVTIEFNPILLGALLFAMADMYILYWYTTRVNESVNSAALEALAIDCLNDIYTSIAVLVGVIGIFFGYGLLDVIAGGFVSILVVYQGIQIARENVTYLVGGAPSQEKRSRIIQTLQSHADVKGVHDVAIYYDGTQLEVEAHVEIDGGLTLMEAHAVETELMNTINAMDNVGDVHLHLDPITPTE